MDDAPPAGGDLLGRPQDQVVVLRPVEAVRNPPSSSTSVAAQHRQVARVHRRAEPLGRPVRLEEVGRLAAVGEHVRLVGVHVVDVVRRRRRAPTTSARARSAPAASSWSRSATNSPRGHRERVVRRGDDAAVRRSAQHVDPRVAGARSSSASTTSGRVEQSSTTHHSQSVNVCGRTLSAQARKRAERRVVDRRDDREPGSDGRRC